MHFTNRVNTFKITIIQHKISFELTLQKQQLTRERKIPNRSPSSRFDDLQNLNFAWV
jgi:hypothetical protein